MREKFVEKWAGFWRRGSRPILWFWSGICLSVGIQSVNESLFEADILKNIARKIEYKTEGKSASVRVDTAAHLVHYLLERRSQILGGGTYTSFKASLFHSSLESFYIGTGACGFYSMFAARVFSELGYPVKIVQQRVLGKHGAHITVVVGLEGGRRWVLVDPLFNHAFKRRDGSLASIEEVAKHWSDFRDQLPVDYNLHYNYQEGYRYTNWDKFGWFSRGIYGLGSWALGHNAMDNFCYRMHVIDPYKIQGMLAFLGFGLGLFGLVYRRR